MRTRTTLIAIASLLALGGCTSETPSETEAPSDGPATSEAAVTDGSASNGWLCGDISPQSLRTLAGGELSEPTEVQIQDDDVRWVCEARDGDTPLMRVTLETGEEARDAARERVQELDDVEEGPDYLGESYSSPALVVGLTLCKDLDSAGSQENEPYTLIAESLVESDEDFSEPLRSTLTQTASGVDQSYGCSPTLARDEAAATSVAP